MANEKVVNLGVNDPKLANPRIDQPRQRNKSEEVSELKKKIESLELKRALLLHETQSKNKELNILKEEFSRLKKTHLEIKEWEELMKDNLQSLTCEARKALGVIKSDATGLYNTWATIMVEKKNSVAQIASKIEEIETLFQVAGENEVDGQEEEVELQRLKIEHGELKVKLIEARLQVRRTEKNCILLAWGVSRRWQKEVLCSSSSSSSSSSAGDGDDGGGGPGGVGSPSSRLVIIIESTPLLEDDQRKWFLLD